MSYTCDTCRAQVEKDTGFFRSVNLRTVAWCRACWFAKHADLGIPTQRTSPADEAAVERAERRWSTPH